MEERKHKEDPQVITKRANPVVMQVATLPENPLEYFQTTTKDAFEKMMKLLVNYPEELRISIYQGNRTTVFNLECNSADRGLIIGKKGKMAAAVRTILESLSAKAGFRAVLNIVE